MKRVPLVLVVASLFCIAWTLDRMDPEDGKILLAHSGGLPEGYDRGWERDWGVMSYCDYAWWGFDSGPYEIQVEYCWSEGADGWDPDYMGATTFLDEFYSTEDVVKSSATRVGTAETVVGDITLVGFDIDDDTYGEDHRECIGFSHGWDKRLVFGDQWFGKFLAVYACGNGARRVSEDTFLGILSGLSIEDEFDALIED